MYRGFPETNLLHQIFLFDKYSPNVLLHRMSFFYLISFFISSYCFLDIFPEAYLFLSMINASSSFLPDWLELIRVTTIQIKTPQKSNIKGSPNPIPNPI